MTFPLLTGRPDRLWMLDHGTFRVTGSTPERVIGIVGFLIGTDAGEYVLVDGGFPPKYLRDLDAAAAEDGLGAFGHFESLRPENAPVAQMALCGIGPDDLTALVLTHTHIDHLGGLTLRPDRPVVIGAPERAMPRPDPVYQPKGPPMEWPDRDWRAVTGDTQVGPGLTVHLVPGHAPGQLALTVVLPDGPIVLMGDSASRPGEVADGFSTTADRATAIASADRLLAHADAIGAQVVWGHCPEQWRTLPRAPDRLG